MTKSDSRPLNVVCLATFFKGVEFIRECKTRGCRVVVVTKERMLQEDWPRDSIDELFAVPNDASTEIFIDLMRHISLQNKIDRVVALEEFDVVLAALIRERSEEHTSELQSQSNLVCRLLLEKKKTYTEQVSHITRRSDRLEFHQLSS